MTAEFHTFAGEGPLRNEEQAALRRYDPEVKFALCRECGLRFLYRCQEAPVSCGRRVCDEKVEATR